MKNTPQSVAPRARQSGFTIVEMMVALAISLIVVLGFAATFVSIKQTFLAQDKLAQLQDNERLAMAILTASAQEAGYYPTPATLDNTQIFPTTPATYGSMAAGQAIFGTTASGTVPESLSMAFAASANDGLITCQGHTVTAADIAAAPSTANGSVGVRNIFYVEPTTKTLNCITLINNTTTATIGGGTTQPLVTNVASMSVLYGVDVGSGSVSGYYTAATFPTAWSSVRSLRVTLNFYDPNDPKGVATIPWVQTINVLNR